MVNQIAEEFSMGRRQRHRPTHMYYRQPNGWITSALAGMIEEAKLMAEGWTPLSAYGRFDVHYAYIADHPHEVLFMRGGAGEMAVGQVIQSGYWLKPPTVPGCRIALSPEHERHERWCWETPHTVDFPQVPADTPKSLDCRFCERQLPTMQARRQHEEVMHKDERVSLITGDTLATSLIRGLREGNAIVTVPDWGGPSESDPDARKALAVLAKVGLNKRQLAALAEAGMIAHATKETAQAETEE